MPDSKAPTGWPPGLLQDDSRDLSRALASKPDAMRHAREAAAAAGAPMPTPTDLPTRLRYGVHCPVSGVGDDTDIGRDMLEAATRIEGMQARLQTLKTDEALKDVPGADRSYDLAWAMASVKLWTGGEPPTEEHRAGTVALWLLAREVERLQAENQALRADSRRFEFWFGTRTKTLDMNEYLLGVRERWPVDHWRAFVDAAMKDHP